MNLHQAGHLSEQEARKYLEDIRWPSGPACPHCGVVEGQYRLNGKAHRAGVLKCGSCRQQYTVTVGTIMERSHIPLSKWVMAFHLMCASKKGVSALQLQRHLGFGSYRTAWHMAHRIRLAMREEPLASLLRGTVEVDETYVGGKPRYRAKSRGSDRTRYPSHRGKAPDFKDRKTPVVALVERGGRVRARVVTDVGSRNLRNAMRDHVDPSARIMTDERPAYRTLGRLFGGGHETVNHLRHEYARGDAHINSAESFFALLKRGIVGQWHNVSRKHLHRYTDEFVWRWNRRKLDTEERMRAVIQGGDRRRLTYRPITA